MTGKIKLVHSGGNAVSIAVPTSNPSSSEVEFKLPQADGSANQVLKTDGSGNLSFAADQGGKFASYAIICDQKAYNADGGTFTANTVTTRDLNTEISDADGIVSIAGNEFTLQAGSYFIRASAPAFFTQRHVAWLNNETDGTVVQYGTAELAEPVNGNVSRSFISARVTISGAKDFRIKHIGELTKSTNGLGVKNNFSGTNSIYTIVEIFKEV
tara:strand:- start:73 stop:711 length:639 start_codon:yes stop_codon:yes gene_type:complete